MPIKTLTSSLALSLYLIGPAAYAMEDDCDWLTKSKLGTEEFKALANAVKPNATATQRAEGARVYEAVEQRNKKPAQETPVVDPNQLNEEEKKAGFSLWSFF